jgi:hypothetical protein
VAFTYRIAWLNQQGVAATWQLVQEVQVDRYLTHSPRVAVADLIARPIEGGLAVALRNLATVAAAENVTCDAWEMVAGATSTSQPSPSRRYFSLRSGINIGPGETLPVFLFRAEEGQLGLIRDDVQRAEAAVDALEAEQGFRPWPGTLACELSWQGRLGGRESRQFQLFVGPVSAPDGTPPAH